MMNRAIQCFLLDTYGQPVWDSVVRQAGLGFDSFEAMLPYDYALTDAVLNAAADRLSEPREMLLEDLGTYLVSHDHTQAIRRLLRFGGATFVEFLYSLDELPDRARMALPDLVLPSLELEVHDSARYALRVTHDAPGFGHVMVGILRALADDYGALVLLDHNGRADGTETVSIELAAAAFAEGRRFDLRAQAS